MRISRRTRIPQPLHPLEMALVAILLAALIGFRPEQFLLPHALLCVAVMLIAGIIASAAVAGMAGNLVPGGTMEFEQHNAATAGTLWQRYIRFSRAVVDYEFRLILMATYLFFVAPIALASRRGRRQSAPTGISNWLARQDNWDPNDVRRPF